MRSEQHFPHSLVYLVLVCAFSLHDTCTGHELRGSTQDTIDHYNEQARGEVLNCDSLAHAR